MTQKGSIFMEKTYTSCRKDYPVFYYTNYEIHETASDLAVTYHFEIPGLSSFAPTWCFPKKAEDCTCWSEDPTLLCTIFSGNGGACQLLEDRLPAKSSGSGRYHQ